MTMRTKLVAIATFVVLMAATYALVHSLYKSVTEGQAVFFSAAIWLILAANSGAIMMLELLHKHFYKKFMLPIISTEGWLGMSYGCSLAVAGAVVYWKLLLQ